jgi:hypothetical protein
LWLQAFFAKKLLTALLAGLWTDYSHVFHRKKTRFSAKFEKKIYRLWPDFKSIQARKMCVKILSQISALILDKIESVESVCLAAYHRRP